MATLKLGFSLDWTIMCVYSSNFFNHFFVFVFMFYGVMS